MPDRAKYIESNRGGRMLSHNGFLYRIDRSRKDRIYYKCIEKNCLARAITEKDFIVSVRETHEHGPSDLTILKKTFASNLKSVVKETTEPVPQLYRRGVIQAYCESNDMEYVPQFHAMKDTLYRARNSNLLSIQPANERENLVLETSIQDSVIFDTHGVNRILALSSPLLMQQLQQSSVIMSDGTFKCVPVHFAQLVTIHGLILGEWEPLLFIYLPDKAEETYSTMWIKIHERTVSPMMAKEFIFDCDLAHINGFMNHWSNTPAPQPRLSLFHFTHSILFKVKELFGLHLYANDGDIKKMVRTCMSLPLCPSERIDEAFMSIMNNSPADHPQHEKCVLFFDYMRTTYLENNSVYPPVSWNQYGRSMTTINPSEGWHHRYNSRIGRKASIHYTLQVLKDEINFTEARIQMRLLGKPPKPMKKRYRNLNENLKKHRADLESGERELFDYLKDISLLVYDI